ncbi:MAG: DUF4407 domain-containing protein [Gemmatimonadaceae bacterium]|nr:DUF4407 domain-containing protein [Chitinophagaceae bacterium]
MADNKSGQAESLYTYDSFGGNKKASSSNFLWWAAGAHQDLLRKFPSEHTKYAGLGGVILATFFLAAISAGYAIYSVFGSMVWTVIFALLWGIIIFNFDRFLVSTMRKYGVSTRKQLWMAVPRIILAVLIGVTIARPLELKIFEKEIDTRIIQNMHTRVLVNDSLLQLENKAIVQSAENERNRLVSRKLSLEDSLATLRRDYVSEADGTGGSGRRGIEKLTKLKMEAYDNAVKTYGPELAQLQLAVSGQDSILNGAKAGLEQKRKIYESTINSNIGFLEKNKALSDLSDEESSVFMTSLLLSVLIILIETGPVISKLIMPIGPYDIALAKEELIHMADSENEIRRNKQQRDVTGQVVEKMTNLQQKHIDEELEKWEKGEWNPRDHRASMDEVLRKLKERYKYKEEDLF